MKKLAVDGRFYKGRGLAFAHWLRKPLLLLMAGMLAMVTHASDYALVINHGRVIDPESGLDATRHIGVRDGTIVAVSTAPLVGDITIDATGLVVAPGFIDLHTHSPTQLGQYYQAFDGVTTALELEAGHYPLQSYGAQISSEAMINFGASAGYIGMRLFEKNGLVMSGGIGQPKPEGYKGWKTALVNLIWGNDAALAPTLRETANLQELSQLRNLLETDLAQGALGVGLALDYISEAVGDAEIAMIFQVAAQAGVPVFVHVRRGIDGDPAGLREVISLAAQYDTSVHVCHISHNAISNLDLFLVEVAAAQEQGVDITTEVLPYNAGSALISSAVFSRDWQTIFNIDYADVEWAATGERFDKAMWDDYRADHPQGQVIHHYLEEAWTQRAVIEPGVIVVSDLLPMESKDKNVAPHNGAFSKVLGRYVREEQLLDLSTALGKMTILPARRLEHFAEAFRRKGRIQLAMDADITIFDPLTIMDNATYQQPYREADGIAYVIVNGHAIIAEGKRVENSFPGKRILATSSDSTNQGKIHDR
ncbi:amidohydrolase family protein [Candidatus Litorirhabdus singularis]|nr:amidohydrolase family protein [Candidatus Litorirhabdus singularis]